MKFENVVFDLYGTLVDIHTDEMKDELWETMSWFYRLHQADVGAKELRDMYFETVKKQENRMIFEGIYEYPEIDLLKVFEELYCRENVFCDERLLEETTILFRACSLEKLKLYQGIDVFLKELKESGRKVYLLTNAQKVFTEKEIELLGLKDMFDGIVYSSIEGVKKPDIQFYKRIEKRYDLNPEKTVMIGNDAQCDVCGAINAGWSAIHMVSNIVGGGICPDSVFSVKVDQLDLLKNELFKMVKNEQK